MKGVLKRFWWAFLLIGVALAFVARWLFATLAQQSVRSQWLSTEQAYKEELEEHRLERGKTKEILTKIADAEEEYEEAHEKLENLRSPTDVANAWNRAFGRKVR